MFRIPATGARPAPPSVHPLRRAAASRARCWWPRRRAMGRCRRRLRCRGRSVATGPAARGHLRHPHGPRRARAGARRASPQAPGEFRLIGKHARRVDARAKIVGQARFGIDVSVPGMVRALSSTGRSTGAAGRGARRAGPRRARRDRHLRLPLGRAVVAGSTGRRCAPPATSRSSGARARRGLDTAELERAARAYRGAAWRCAATATRTTRYAIRSRHRRGGLPGPTWPTLRWSRRTAWWRCAATPPRCGRRAKCDRDPEVVADAVGIASDDVLVHTTYAGGGFGRRCSATTRPSRA